MTLTVGGSKVCPLCERPWIFHTGQERSDCQDVISYLKEPSQIKLIEVFAAQTKRRSENTTYREVYDL